MKTLISVIKSCFCVNRKASLLCLTLLSLALMLGGCGAEKSIDDVINQIDQTTRTIESISDGWRDELPKLVKDLNGLESRVNADIKGIVADTTNQLQDLSNQTIQFSDAKAQDLVAQAGVEFRCNAGFVKAGVVAQLKYIVDDLKFWKLNHRHLDKKPTHAVCWINPTALSLYPSGNAWAIDTSNMPDKNIMHVFGYNYWSEVLPTLELQDANSQKIRDVKLTAAYVTHYQINLDFSNEDFAEVASGARVVFRWPDQDDPNTVNLTLHPPARLKISNPVFGSDAPTGQPPTAQKDAVYLKVTITNQGGLRSGNFVVNWTPDPNDPKILSISRLPLNPGESADVSFPGYVYQRGGMINSTVSIDNGDDAQTYPLMVAAPSTPKPPEFFIDYTDQTTVSGWWGDIEDGFRGSQRYKLDCPTGTMGVGLDTRADAGAAFQGPRLLGISIICRTPNSADAAPVGDQTKSEYLGRTSGAEYASVCNGDIPWLLGITYRKPENVSYSLIEGVGLVCYKYNSNPHVSQQSEYHGGSNGDLQPLTCPAGYVVTSISGGHKGDEFWSVQVVCTRLNVR